MIQSKRVVVYDTYIPDDLDYAIVVGMGCFLFGLVAIVIGLVVRLVWRKTWLR